MKRIIHLIFAGFFIVFFQFLFAAPVQAEVACSDAYSSFSMSTELGQGWPSTVNDQQDYVGSDGRFNVTFNNLTPNTNYRFVCRSRFEGLCVSPWGCDSDLYDTSGTTNAAGVLSIGITANDCFNNDGKDEWSSRTDSGDYRTQAYIRLEGGAANCDTAQYYDILWRSSGATCGTVSVRQTSRETENNTCYQPSDTGTWSFSVNGAPNKNFQVALGNYTADQFLGVDVDDGRNYFLLWNGTATTGSSGTAEGSFTLGSSAGVDNIGKPFSFYVFDPGVGRIVCESNLGTVRALCGASPEPLPGESTDSMTTFSICRQIPVMKQEQIDAQVNRIQDPEEKARIRTALEERIRLQRVEKVRCCSCTYGTTSWNEDTGACSGEDGTDIVRQRRNFKPGLYTAVGCIGIDQESIITRLVRIGLGIAGGVALLMILTGAFMLSTSQGEPKRAGEAKELITSAVIGLIFIIFSVTIMQFIGVTILRIPGFGGETATGM